MDLPSLTPDLIAALVVLGGVALGAGAARALARRHRDRRYGALVAADAGSGVTLSSPGYRLRGRPDLLRRLSDGRVVPIELKSRAAPAAGPPRSHIVQVWAYCLLVESSFRVSPPYGVLRYGDGAEFRVAWNDRSRDELLGLRAELDRPYDGRATPSPAKCAHCAWRKSCDARAV